jgi:dihydrodipicolinate reductase
MSTRVALTGAGGKMGCRITDDLEDRSGERPPSTASP